MIASYLRFDRDTSEYHAFADWWRGLDNDRGERALLRRCRSLTEVVFTPAYHRLRVAVSRCGIVNDDSLALVAGLAARVKTDTDDAQIAEQMAGGKPDGSARVSGLRFRRLLKVHGTEEMLSAMSRTIALLDGSVNLQNLVQSVYWWNDQTRKKWAFDYYSKASSEA